MCTFFGICLFLVGIVKLVQGLKMERVKMADPERWARITAAEDARKRAAAGGALRGGLKIAQFLLKR
jgi:hypothetical protein